MIRIEGIEEDELRMLYGDGGMTQLEIANCYNSGSVHKKDNGWRLGFSVNDSIALYHFLYDNCGDLFLPRKKEKFEELMERQLK